MSTIGELAPGLTLPSDLVIIWLFSTGNGVAVAGAWVGAAGADVAVAVAAGAGAVVAVGALVLPLLGSDPAGEPNPQAIITAARTASSAIEL